MWPRSAWLMPVCPRRRRTMAEKVSMMGTAAITSGTMMVVRPAKRVTESRETAPSAKPRVSAPESPMKIEAGWKL